MTEQLGKSLCSQVLETRAPIGIFVVFELSNEQEKVNSGELRQIPLLE